MTSKLPVKNKRNVLITSALPYVNNVPHLGNIIGCVLSADVYARYRRKKGDNVLYVCGTDDYGTTSEIKALEEGLPPHEVCEKYHELHEEIYKKFNISFDYFGKTSCPDPKNDEDWLHTKITHEIFTKLYNNGFIIKKEIEQVYCDDCKKFLADRYIAGTCPKCKHNNAKGDQCDNCSQLLQGGDLLNPKCKVCNGTNITSKNTKHLYLDLTKCADSVTKFFNDSKHKWDKNAVAVTEAWLKKGLEPRCITRDLKWGTPVPNLKGLEDYQDKVFYVWFDAPIGYLSITANLLRVACTREHSPVSDTINYNETTSNDWKKWWMTQTEDDTNVELVQFFSKDNIPFHSILFPATLLGTGTDYNLVSSICSVHYLTYYGTKFSKSNQIGVFGDDVDQFDLPIDAWRYYLLVNRPESGDTSFTWEDFFAKHDGDLTNNFSNFVHRVLSFCYKHYKKTPKITIISDYDKDFVAEVDEHINNYHQFFESNRMKDSLRTVMVVAILGNKYINESEPWKMIKTNPEKCGSVMGILLNLVKLIGSLMEPFMPETADKIRQFLNVNSLDLPIKFEFDLPQTELNKPEILFRQQHKKHLGDDAIKNMIEGYKNLYGYA